jgi:hypothetical protein
MRSLPQEVIDIDWNELSPNPLGGESRELELLREIYESDDLEGRETALDTGFQWFDTCASAKAQWIRSLLPLLSDKDDPLVPTLLMYLSLCADTSFPQRDATAQEIAAVTAAIRSGYEKYLKLFPVAPLSVQGLLITSPDRASEYLPLLFSLYETESDPAIRAGVVLTLAEVAGAIPDWRNRLLAEIREGVDSALAFVCAAEIIRLDGDNAPREIFDIAIKTSSGDGASKIQRKCLVQLLPRLTRSRQITMLMGFLKEAKYTQDCFAIAKFLLEAVYGQIGVVSDFPDMASDAGSTAITTHFKWVGPSRTSDLQLPARNGHEDWLGAIVNKEALWDDINPYRPPGEADRTNLYELFGLPSERHELERLWSDGSYRP